MKYLLIVSLIFATTVANAASVTGVPAPAGIYGTRNWRGWNMEPVDRTGWNDHSVGTRSGSGLWQHGWNRQPWNMGTTSAAVANDRTAYFLQSVYGHRDGLRDQSQPIRHGRKQYRMHRDIPGCRNRYGQFGDTGEFSSALRSDWL